MTLMLMTITALMTPVILMSLGMIMSSKTYKSMSMNNPFQCGFNPLSPIRMSFSIQFFMIAILFLIFDIEIVLILPVPLMKAKYFKDLTTIVLIVFLLMVGLFYEWINGALKWS